MSTAPEHPPSAGGPRGEVASSAERSETIRDRLIASASQITTDRGWSAVTMSKVAGRVGVSRQTVYNELGSKAELGQAMVLRELERFLAVVEVELDSHDDLREAIAAAAEQTLVMARDNRLLHAVLTSAHGVVRGDTTSSAELLAFLTTDAEPLIDAAKAVISRRIPVRFPDVQLSPREIDIGIDAAVRLLLSHVMQPGGTPESTAAEVAWIVGRVLGGPADPS